MLRLARLTSLPVWSLLLLVTLLLLIGPISAKAFDDDRKGFVAGFGLGGAPVVHWSRSSAFINESKPGFDVDLLLGHGFGSRDLIVWNMVVSAFTSDVIAVRNWVNAGGALLLEGDQNLSSFNLLLDSLHAGVRYVDNNPPNGITTSNKQPHVTTENIDSLYSTPVGRLVVDPSLQVLVWDLSDQFPLIAPVQINNGVIYAMADEFFSDYAIANLAENQLFANQVFDWLVSSVSWLSVTPSSGVVAAGDSTKITVRMDGTELTNGNYSAKIIVTSNDPLNSEFPILVDISVRDFVCGDGNADGIVDGDDLIFLWEFYFLGGPAPVPMESVDIDCNGGIDLADLVRLADHFIFGRDLTCCDGSPPPEEQSRTMTE